MLHFLLIGWITVVSSVGGAEVMVDENDGVRMHGKQLCLEVEAGRHLVMVDKEGYYPYIDTVTVSSADNQQLEIWLEPQSAKAIKHTSHFKRLAWDYQMANGVKSIRWGAIGAGLGTGLDVHVSLFSMRFGLLSVEPCIWGINLPFYTNATHVDPPWQVHQRDRRDDDMRYEVAVSSPGMQWYYTPMLGVHLPIFDHVAFAMSAGPQLSWTRIYWNVEWRTNPFTHDYTFTEQDFPKTGYQFDPIWFSVQAGVVYTGNKSDLMTYFKYQDGFFIGLEARF